MNVSQKKPEVVVFAGPNGSGKSTFTELLKPPMDYIYDRALALVKDLIKICDVCHIYDNSGSKPFRILKKRKEQIYFDECADWYFEDIQALTAIRNMEKRDLN